MFSYESYQLYLHLTPFVKASKHTLSLLLGTDIIKSYSEAKVMKPTYKPTTIIEFDAD